MANYRRPGVYLEESLLLNPSDVAGTTTVAAFVGLTAKGPVNSPYLVESWSQYYTVFGGFDPVPPPTGDTGPSALSYMPFAVYTFFQNGGRFAWIVRASDADEAGDPATITVLDNADPAGTAFNLNAISSGAWGNKLGYRLSVSTTPEVFTLEILQQITGTDYEAVEVFYNLTITGEEPGTRRVDTAINDPLSGSRYVRVSDLDLTKELLKAETAVRALAGGSDPGFPEEADLLTAVDTLSGIEGPMMINVVSYLTDANDVADPGAGTIVGNFFDPTGWANREDVMSINDYCPAKDYSDTEAYSGLVNTALSPGSTSYVAAYTPWIVIPHPTQTGGIISIPPGGAVLGVTARIDATIGYHRAPAGVVAVVSNAVGVQAKFTDPEQGDLNNANINVIRPVVGSGICIMGARTRKGYGPDHYINARRTLINIKEQLRRSTQYAVFENNDERLWSSLQITAESILRPLWERGGLRGASPQQAYYTRCDATLNTIQVISQGEVRMEVGVALQYPAEFVIIRITQITSSTFTNEIQVV